MTSQKYAYSVVRDTREKVDQGWFFPKTELCSGTIIQKLDTGDYSISGLEPYLAIERKGSVGEFCTNLTQDRFVAPYDPSKPLDKQSEFVRLEYIRWPFILLEFSMTDLIKYPNIPSIPPRLRNSIKFKGHAALKKMLELQMMYKTKILFCDNETSAKSTASSIFKRVIEQIEAEQNANKAKS